jgi:hypothetical protein
MKSDSGGIRVTDNANTSLIYEISEVSRIERERERETEKKKGGKEKEEREKKRLPKKLY